MEVDGMTDDRWLTVTEITERLQVHRETVRRWLRDGRLQGRNFGGKMGYRIRQSELDRFLNEEPEEQAKKPAA